MQPVRVALFLPLTFTIAGVARADIPDIPASAYEAACNAAKEVDACPSCSCQMITSTMSRKETDSSPVPLGVVLLVKGTTPDGNEYKAIHAAIGPRDNLDHLGRLAESRGGGVGETTFEVTAQAQGYQGCPGGCDYEAMGLIHPFEVTTVETGINESADGEFKATRTTLVLCYEAMGGNTCAAMPIALDHSVKYMQMAPGHVPAKPVHESFKRTWKLGKRGDLELGKATGKAASKLSEPKAFKISLTDIAGHPDAIQLVRWPSPSE